MTDYEWVMISLGGLGLLITVGTILVSVTRATTKVTSATDKKMLRLEQQITRALQSEIQDSNISQDEVFREVASGLRKFIEKVESEMHQIEMWGRDNYVQKPDFKNTTDRLFDQLDSLAGSIKDDFRELYRRLENSKLHK